jgi:hypothetical protein
VPTAATPSLPVALAPLARPGRDGDVDGDGRPDVVTVTGTTVVVAGTRVGVMTMRAPAPSLPLATVTDIDDDGFGEILLAGVQADGITRYTVLRFNGTVLGAVRGLPGGGTLPVGVTKREAHGFRCVSGGGSAGGGVTVFDGTSNDGHAYAVKQTFFQMNGSTLTPVATTSTTVADTDGGFPAPFVADCGPLHG